MRRDRESDQRRERMQELLSELATLDAGKALRAVEELFEVYEEEKLTVVNYRAVNAFQAV